MAIPISNVTRRAVYAPSGAGGAGPYAFTFEILANTDIAVYKDDTLLTLTTHYTVTINANGTGSVTITATGLALAPVSPTQYAIVGNRTISRATDFTTGGDFFANTLNDELDQQTIFAQQNSEGLIRALQAPQTDPTTVDMTLPRATVRANKTLAFDANGDPTTGEVIGDNRGNWAAGVAYNKRDIVKDTSNGNVYYANTSHTSSGSQPISTNADSAKWDLIVDNASATTSATNAAASASAASTSASNASTSATNAASSASTASTQASNASTSATTAASSASSASSSASTASTAATNAGTSATAASTSATSASSSATSASGSASTATTQASNASTSATAAAGSASTATTQATNAATSASGASTSASNASTSATAAQTAQAAAEAARDSALAAYDNFDDRYLGAKSSNPTLDNDGNALLAGALYFNTVVPEMRLWTGSAWVAAYVSGTGFLASANNLSDVASTSTARNNLGLGTGDSPQFTALNVGNASDTTVTRASAGVIAVEGNNVLTANNIGTSVQAYSAELQGASQGGIYGFKNRIINGAMVIDQRNAGASGTASAYTVDRWGYNATQASKATWQQNAGSVAPPAGFTNYLGITSSSAYSVLTGDTFYLSQAIEGFNVADLSWGSASASTVTLSFWVRSSLTGTFGGALVNSASNRSYPFSYTISAANTWEYKTITIAGDTTGTWLTNNGVGITLRLGLGSGSTYTGTAGAWAASNLVQSTGSQSIVGTNGATFYITGVQLEKGSTATSFDYRPYGTELALCQRYYEILTNDSNGYSIISGMLASTSSSYANWFFKQTKRSSPTISTVTGNTWTAVTPTITPSIDHVIFYGSNYFYNSGAANTIGITASAEL